MIAYFIAGFAIVSVLAAIILGLVSMANNEKYNDMKEHYDERIEKLKRENDYYNDRYFRAVNSSSQIEAKNKLYEEIVNKLLDKQSDTTDSVFIFEGKIYRLVSFTLSRDQDTVDTLDVEFVKAEL